MISNASTVTLRVIGESLARYFRYTVEGFEHLREPGPKMLVAYHGRPIAWDQLILATRMHRYLGELPVAVAHAGLFSIPVVGEFFRGLGAVAHGTGELERAVARGRSILVTPGGTMEGCRSSFDHHRVNWGSRRGYLELARRLSLPIVPVGTYGVDFPFLNLVDGDTVGRLLRIPAKVPAVVSLGPLGLFPFSPPFPVRFHQIVGPAIQPSDFPHELEAFHQLVVGRVQANLDEARRVVRRRSRPYGEAKVGEQK